MICTQETVTQLKWHKGTGVLMTLCSGGDRGRPVEDRGMAAGGGHRVQAWKTPLSKTELGEDRTGPPPGLAG